jgi:hypothetical protein
MIAGTQEPGMRQPDPALHHGFKIFLDYISRQENLEHILQQFSQQERLGTCALVCRAWHTAAVAASTDVSLTHFSDSCGSEGPISDDTWHTIIYAKTESLAEWLLKHGSAVQHLTISGAQLYELYEDFEELQVAMPFAQLRQLRSLSLSGPCRIYPLGDPACSDPWSLLTSLTALGIDCVQGIDFDCCDGIAGISTLTGLRELSLYGPGEVFSAGADSPLLHLQQLTALSIGEMPEGTVRAAAVITQLTSLRRLDWMVRDLKASQAAGLAALTNLTELHCSYSTERAAGASSALKGRSVRCMLPEHKHLHLFSTVSPARLCVALQP